MLYIHVAKRLQFVDTGRQKIKKIHLHVVSKSTFSINNLKIRFEMASVKPEHFWFVIE